LPKLTAYCATSGCHGGSVKAGGLDLRPNSGLISRIVEVPALHRTYCGFTEPCDSDAGTCDNCVACPKNDKLIDAQNVDESWILRKMEPFMPPMTSTANMMCGDVMPTFNGGNSRAYTSDDKLCLTRFFRKIAKTPGTFPCNAGAGAGGMAGGAGASASGAGGAGAAMSGVGGT
jgi:hypothetical protein